MKLVTTTADLAKYYTEKSIAAPLEGIPATGFKHVDLSMYGIVYNGSPWLAAGDGWKIEVEKCMEAAECNGLDFCQAHSPCGNSFEPGNDKHDLILATKRSIEACGMLGIPHTVIHGQAIYGGTPKEFLQKNIEFCKLFEEDLERHNVNLLIENTASQWNPECYVRTGREMREFVDSAGMPRLHICWDIGHGNVQGQNQYDDILIMGDELRALHVQDNYGNADSHIMPMAGTTNFDNVIRALLKIGYKGDFTFEAGCTLRRAGAWPNYRRDIKDGDILANPPLYIQQKQQAVLYEIGKWMLESYNIAVQ